MIQLAKRKNFNYISFFFFFSFFLIFNLYDRCVPDNVEMWLALARLETYDKAKVVLNKAIRAIPSEPQIWITAAMLEEAHNANEEKTRDIIKKGMTNDYVARVVESGERREKAKVVLNKAIRAIPSEPKFGSQPLCSKRRTMLTKKRHEIL